MPSRPRAPGRTKAPGGDPDMRCQRRRHPGFPARRAPWRLGFGVGVLGLAALTRIPQRWAISEAARLACSRGYEAWLGAGLSEFGATGPTRSLASSRAVYTQCTHSSSLHAVYARCTHGVHPVCTLHTVLTLYTVLNTVYTVCNTENSVHIVCAQSRCALSGRNASASHVLASPSASSWADMRTDDPLSFQ